MSGLRQDFIDAMSDRWGGDAESVAEYTAAADDLLRVLAEHGDTQQVREQLVSSGALALPRGDRINAVMAVVAPHLAARDERIEQYKTLRQTYVEVSADEEHYATRAKEFLDRAERAEADLAAARMQVRVRDARLDQMRALADDWKRQSVDHYETYGAPALVNLGAHAGRIIQALDAPARPARHDETGQ
jgi:hypothetical protein